MNYFNAVHRSNEALFEGVRIVYDAEAIFALRDVLKQRLNGVDVSSDKVDGLVQAEIGLGRCADRIVTVSRAEAAEFSRRGFPEVFVLGHQIPPRPTPAAFEQRRGILFVGAMHGDDTPNVDSVLWFAEAVWPALSKALPEDVEFIVAGTNRSDAVCRLYGDRLRVCGFVEDLSALYDACRLFVAPTRYAAGIPYKAHEAAARGLPMVTTSLIAGQLGWRDGEDLLVADTPEDFARQCLALYRDKDIWRKVRQSALQRITAETSIDSFRANLAAVLAESEPAKAASAGR
jgi:glycosyltransferase involved in cell wall biosynthesis